MKKILLAFILTLISFQGVSFSASLSQVLEWKYGACAGTRQFDSKDTSAEPKMVISYWKCEEKQPDENQIEIDTQEYKEFVATKGLKNVQEDDALKTKLKLSDAEIDVIARLVKERL